MIHVIHTATNKTVIQQQIKQCVMSWIINTYLQLILTDNDYFHNHNIMVGKKVSVCKQEESISSNMERDRERVKEIRERVYYNMGSLFVWFLNVLVNY